MEEIAGGEIVDTAAIGETLDTQPEELSEGELNIIQEGHGDKKDE